MNSILVIIPARNEETSLSACLSSLKPFQDAGDDLLVVDAQSTDTTAEIAKITGISCRTSPYAQRGYSIAWGIMTALKNTSPDIILIAHADMVFAPDARDVMLRSLQSNPDYAGGCFGHIIRNTSSIYRVIERGNSNRARLFGLSYGDQAQFFRRDWMLECGGFPWMPRLEDLELTLRMRPRHLFLNHPVSIPARHWHRGIVFTTARNWYTVGCYLLKRSLGWHSNAKTDPVSPFPAAEHDPAS